MQILPKRLTSLELMSTGFPVTEAQPYKRKFNTLGHEVLDLESQVDAVPDACYKQLDQLIKAAKQELKTKKANNPEEAIAILKQIESVLIQHHFICSIPRLVDSFKTGLSPQALDVRIAGSDENQYRKPFIDAHASDDFYYVDCDLSSLIYLSIAEAIGLPLAMVEIPGHNFIRWHFDEHNYLNWDTNYGNNQFSDDAYREQKQLPLSLLINQTYLTSLSRTEVKGYFYFLRGIAWQSKAMYSHAIEDYLISITLYPRSTSARNNLAWLYVSIPEIQYRNPAKQALKLAQEAVQIHRAADVLDTLACAYAENGDFETAVSLEEEALELDGNPAYFARANLFRTEQTYLDYYLSHGGPPS